MRLRRVSSIDCSPRRLLIITLHDSEVLNSSRLDVQRKRVLSPYPGSKQTETTRLGTTTPRAVIR